MDARFEFQEMGFVFTVRDPYAFRFGPDGHYCAGCGMVWAQADPKDAADFLKRFVADKLKARLDAIDAVAATHSATTPGLPPRTG
jgi:hypothetical protein